MASLSHSTTVLKHPEVEDYFVFLRRERSGAAYYRAYGDAIADWYEQGKVIVMNLEQRRAGRVRLLTLPARAQMTCRVPQPGGQSNGLEQIGLGELGEKPVVRIFHRPEKREVPAEINIGNFRWRWRPRGALSVDGDVGQ